jgi:hypothetical protein
METLIVAAIGTKAVAISELLTGLSAEPRNMGVTNRQEKALLGGRYHGDNYEVLVHRFFRKDRAGTPQAAERLADAVARRMPERSLLSIVARTAYWLGWYHHFGPASGSDPKIANPLGRYCMAVFTGGVNIGPYEAARHIAGVAARELSMVRNRHIDLKKLNAAIATVVNAFAELPSSGRGSPPRPTRSSPTTGSPTGWRSGTTACWPTTTRPSRRS